MYLDYSSWEFTITFYAKAAGYCKRLKKIAKDNRNIDKTVAKNEDVW